MPKVSTTVGASDFHAPHAVGVVYMSVHSARDIVIVCRPATTRVELVLRPAAFIWTFAALICLTLDVLDTHVSALKTIYNDSNNGHCVCHIYYKRCPRHELLSAQLQPGYLIMQYAPATDKARKSYRKDLLVQWCPTTSTVVHPLISGFVVLASASWLSALLTQNVILQSHQGCCSI